MIYTITFNPALDYIVSVRDFKMGMTNRTDKEMLLPGGKGINVSIVLENLGFKSTALGFTAGFTGDEITRRLEAMGCNTEFINIGEGSSRINIKISNSEGTEINGQGPKIDKLSLHELLCRLDFLEEGDILILAGSIPPSIPGSIYQDICKQLAGRGIMLIVDAAGNLLKSVLPFHPFLIKPNNYELGEIFGLTLSTVDEIIPYAKKLQEMGAGNVLVSMSKEGAVLAAENGEIYTSKTPPGRLINAVGAGDSMVAGFLAGWLKTGDYEKAFKMGVAAGSASAFSEMLATKEEVEKLLNSAF